MPSFPTVSWLLCLPVTGMAQVLSDAPQTTPTEARFAPDRVEVVGSRPATMPTEVPTTTQSISAQQIEQTINATDSEDALKYFPSLNVRKRYIGDYDHAVLATRASGTGNSARSLVFVDVRVLYRLNRQWSIAAGIDNLGNQTYWAFHPYTQRTFNAELRFDL